MTGDRTLTARSFLKDHAVGVLATLSPESTPRARTVYYAADDSFGVYFCTLSETRKVDDIARNAHAAFVVSAEETPQTIQIEGTIADLTETATISDVVRKLLQKFMERGAHFAPLAHLDPGTVRFYKLTPTWVRFADFTDGIGADKAYTDIPL